MSASDFATQVLPNWQRAVLKVGSSLLAGATDAAVNPGLHTGHAAALAGFIERSRAQGREVVLVSSGAVAAGRGRIGAAGDGLVLRQALASLGQASLIGFWQQLASQPVAQVLGLHGQLRQAGEVRRSHHFLQKAGHVEEADVADWRQAE